MAKVLLIIPSLAQAGGTERVVAGLSKLLSTSHEVAVCAFDEEGTRPHFKTEVSFFPLGGSKRLPLLIRWITYAGQARRLRALKRRLGVEVSISNLWRADFVNYLSGGCDKKIALAHTNLQGNAANRLMLRLRRLVGTIYRSFDALVAVSDAVAAELTNLYKLDPAAVRSINNFADISAPIADTAGKTVGPTLVWCGRFVEEKNVRALFPIFGEVYQAHPPARLILVGAGPDLEEVQKTASALGLLGKAEAPVRFTGPLEDPTRLISSADMLLLPSLAEGMPMVILEALSLGVPIAAADCPSGGVHQLLGAVTAHDPDRMQPEITTCGVLLPIPVLGDTRRERLWVDELSSLISDRTRLNSLREGALRRAKAFGPEAALSRWNAVIEEVLH